MTEVELCKQYIREYCKVTKNIITYHNSYGWKHRVENWAGRYISNDNFIDATIELTNELGIKYREYEAIIKDPTVKYKHNREFNLIVDKKKLKDNPYKQIYHFDNKSLF